MMKSYVEWCQHYDYDPASEQAKTDYQRYLDQLAVFRSLTGTGKEEKTDDRQPK